VMILHRRRAGQRHWAAHSLWDPSADSICFGKPVVSICIDPSADSIYADKPAVSICIDPSADSICFGEPAVSNCVSNCIDLNQCVRAWRLHSPGCAD
jgi:hypothetical protein